MEIREILSRLKGVRRAGDGKWSARCCAHDDSKPSLSIRDVGNGRVLLNCFAGCSYESIISALGIDPHRRPSPYVPPPQIKKAIEDPPLDAQGTWQRWFERTDYHRVDGLGMSLGVDTDALRAIGCAWAPEHHAYAFPMRDAQNKVIGIRLRTDAGKKFAVKGSHQGIFIPTEYPFCVDDATLYVVEGPTDLAAALTLGLYAIGRAACLGQETMIVEFIRSKRVRRIAILSDLDDPGIRGAEKLQALLPVLSLIVLLPAKDVREFLNNGGTKTLVDGIVKDLVWSQPKQRAA